jgi:site-specific recombinase XerD
MKSVFYLSTPLKNGYSNVVARIRKKSHGIDITSNTGVLICPGNFNRALRRVDITDPEFQAKNEKLNAIEVEIRKIQRLRIPADQIRYRFKLIFDPDYAGAFTLLGLCMLYIEAQRKKIGLPEPVGIIQSTFVTYLTRYNNIKKFLQEGKNENIAPEEINNQLLEDFVAWMCNKGRKPGSINKHFCFLRSALEAGIDLGLIHFNAARSFTLKDMKGEPDFLSAEDLKKISDEVFPCDRLQRVADLFLIQSYTGMSYETLRRFDRSLVNASSQGITWLKYNRGKTHQLAIVPLYKNAIELFEKYDYTLPRVSNQKYNDYLKEIATICGIKRDLKTHLARKSAGNMFLNEGLSLESVSRILGHASVKTTESVYAAVRQNRIALEIRMHPDLSANMTFDKRQLAIN